MFQPLSAEEVTPVEVSTGTDKVKPRPIVPVPADAPPLDYRHPKRGAPSKAWAYLDPDTYLASRRRLSTSDTGEE